MMDDMLVDDTALGAMKPRWHARMVVVDLDGTLLRSAATFEERDVSERTVRTLRRAHEAGARLVVATARPVSTAWDLVNRMPVDACVYLNGALVDCAPGHSSYDALIGGKTDDMVLRFGFSSQRACEVCAMLLRELPSLRVGIVMNDVRYANFDVSVLWKTQTWRYTDFTDVPHGVADKIIVLPEPDDVARLEQLIPDDFRVGVSEGVMWMLMSPDACKEHAVRVVGERCGVALSDMVAFGDDLIDMAMMREVGWGVAVANANEQVLAMADEVCASNDEDGVAQWLERHYRLS